MEQVEYESDFSEYADAFRSAQAAKNIFSWILMLAILVQLASFVLVNFVGVVDVLKGADPMQTAAADSQQPGAEAPVDSGAVQSAATWYHVLMWVLPGTKFLAVVLAALLVLTLLFAVKLSLLGRLSGISQLVSAFFWSLILLAMVTPWQQILHSSIACGALYNYTQLVEWVKLIKTGWNPSASPSALSRTIYYARFMAYPLIAVLVWLVVQTKFARGCRQMNLSAAVAAPKARPAEPQA